MQGELRNGRPDGEEAELRPVATERGIAIESTRQKVDGDGGAETMAGDDDLVRITALRARDDARRECLDTRLHVGMPTHHVVAGEDPIGQRQRRESNSRQIVSNF